MEIFEYIKGYIHVWQFLHPKSHPKIIIGLWKRYSISQSYLCLLKCMLRFLTKLLVKLLLSDLLIFLRCVQFWLRICAQKYQKTATVPLNGCGIVWIWLCPLDFILKFPTKWLVKACFGDFGIFLRLYLRLMIFASPKPQKIVAGLWKRYGTSQKLLLLIKINVKLFDWIVC